MQGRQDEDCYYQHHFCTQHHAVGGVAQGRKGHVVVPGKRQAGDHEQGEQTRHGQGPKTPAHTRRQFPGQGGFPPPPQKRHHDD